MRSQAIVIAFASFLALPTAAYAAAAPAPVGGRVEELKAEILQIAQRNRTRRDNLEDVRAALQPLVDELVTLVPQRTESEKRAQVAGGWENVWTDLDYGTFYDYARSYQVVFADGYYYNVTRALPPSGEKTVFLRGAFVDRGDELAIRFTRQFALEPWLAGANLVEIGAKAEAGTLTGEPYTPGDFSPVGIEGRLRNSFVDGDIRIIEGNANGQPESLFVLKRAVVLD